MVPNPARTVEFHSAGRLLIIGTGESAVRAAKELAQILSCHLLGDAPIEVPRGVAMHWRDGSRVDLDGHLGAFRVRLESSEDSLNLGQRVDPDRPVFDLVLDLDLDLDQESAIDREWGPPGYFRPPDEQALQRALVDLSSMKGTLEKPKFFDFNATLCAHGQPGTEGCRRCLEVCPAEAIQSIESKIEVDANLCQGAGVCTATCPTGALTYRYPPRSETLEHLYSMLATFRESGASERPTLVFIDHRADPTAVAAWPENVLPYELREVASAGMEVWFSALASGSGSVKILRGPDLPRSVERTLDEQLGYARAILDGLGYPADTLSWMAPEDDPLQGGHFPPAPPAPLVHAQSKRGVLFAALDYLLAHAPDEADVLPTANGAPFGQVHVQAEACTTCLACAFT